MSSVGTRTIAELSPRTYLGTMAFWWTHRQLVGTLLAGGLAVSWLFALSWPQEPPSSGSEGTEVALALETLNWVFMILLVFGAIWGARAALVVLADIGVNRAVAQTVESGAEERLRRYQGGERIEVKELWSLLPHNVSKPEPAMIRLVQQICKEAESRRFESSVNLIQPYREESLRQLSELERVQRFSLRIGILGTFIGLLLALGALPAAIPTAGAAKMEGEALAQRLQQGQESFQQLSRDLLGSLGLAFGTSAVGIGVAALIAALGEIARRRQSLYFKEMEDVAITVVALASRSLNRDDLLAGLEQASRAMKEVELQVYDQTRKLEKSLGVVEARVDLQTGRIAEGLDELTHAKQDLLNFLQQLAGTQKVFLDDLRALYDLASMKRLFGGVENAVLGAQTRFSQELREGVGEFSGKLEQIHGSLGMMYGGLSSVSQEVAKGLQGLQATLGKVESRLAESARQNQSVIGQIEDLLSRVPASDTIGSDATYFKPLFYSALAGMSAGVLVSPNGPLGALAGAVLAPALVAIYRWQRS